MFLNERVVGTALCVSGLLLAIGALVWLLHDDEKQRHRLGIAPEEWERGRETVRKSMGDPWEKAFRKMVGIRSTIEKRVSE